MSGTAATLGGRALARGFQRGPGMTELELGARRAMWVGVLTVVIAVWSLSKVGPRSGGVAWRYAVHGEVREELGMPREP